MIISNSTPLIYLSRVGKLDILREVFKRVIIPQAVFTEVVEKGEEKDYPDVRLIKKAIEKWIEVKKLTKKEREDCEGILKIAPVGLGEAEAISLAKSMKLPIITDDTIAHKVAKIFMIESYWTTSVVFRALNMKIIERSEAKKIIEDLINSGIRLKPEVVIEIMKQLE